MMEAWAFIVGAAMASLLLGIVIMLDNICESLERIATALKERDDVPQGRKP